MGVNVEDGVLSKQGGMSKRMRPQNQAGTYRAGSDNQARDKLDFMVKCPNGSAERLRARAESGLLARPERFELPT